MTSAAAIETAYRLARAGNHAEAARLYGEILSREPRNAQALYLLGFLHFERGEFVQAERLMGQALDIDPVALDALHNRAAALLKLGRASEALSLYDRMLLVNRRIVEAWQGRAMAFAALKRESEALASCDRALALSRDVASLTLRAELLYRLGQLEEAGRAFEDLLAVAPGAPYALGSLAQCRMQLCDWRDYGRLRGEIAAALRDGKRVVQPGEILALSASTEEQLVAARSWVAHETPAAIPSHSRRFTHDRIRLAYLSADFRSHAVAYLIAGVLEAHDRDRFEITVVPLSPDDGSAVRRRIAAAAGRVVDVGPQTDAEIAASCRQSEIDIAIDLMGYTAGSRAGIFAQHAAPVQVSYLGYPGTSGAPYMDYLLADETVIPSQAERFYSETIIRLPGAYLPCETGLAPEPRPSRAEAGLPDTGFVFCCLCASYKITPEIFAIWMRLLRAVEGSVLWLATANAAAARNLRARAREAGVSPERLIFAPYAQARAEHLARVSLGDIALDTLPYGGHATALDALSAGVPVVTVEGATFAGRVAASLLRTLGLRELVASSLVEYEATALMLARDPEARLRAKQTLARAGGAPLFDMTRYTRGLEAAYEQMLDAVP